MLYSYSPVRKFIFLIGTIEILKSIVFIVHEIKISFKIFVDLGAIKAVCYVHIINTLTVL